MSDYFPTVELYLTDGGRATCHAFGRETVGTRERLLLGVPNGGRVWRYALYPYCRTHNIAWEAGEHCPLCQEEIQARLKAVAQT